MFGYDEGAFTGASKGGRIGLFEQANGGTIFLDEIGDISLRLQARLLRVLQEKEIRRVGGTEIIPLNVRIISATNKDLAQMCRTGLFREDLYHRLRKLYLKLPPLRDHLEDLPELIDSIKRMNGRSDLVLSDEVMDILRLCPWTGNVRELGNVIEYFIVVADNGRIEAEDIPPDFFEIKKSGASCEDPYTEELYKTGNYEESISILKAISECPANGCAASRKTVTAVTMGRFPHMTENKVRRRTDYLLKIGLIDKRPGPGGMHLTKAGHEFLRRIDE